MLVSKFGMIYNNNEVIIINFVLLLSEFCCNFISSALIEWFCEGVDELTALLQLVFNCKKSVLGTYASG